jgi:tol-pal system protein YbgF
MSKLSLFAVLLVAGTSLSAPSFAQDADRIDQLEQQVRQLTGQVEELTYLVKQMQKAEVAAPTEQKPRKLAAQEEPLMQDQQPLAGRKKQVVQSGIALNDDGIEIIEDGAVALAKPKRMVEQDQTQTSIYGDEAETVDGLAPGPAKLGAANNRAASPNDGGFQGQIVVPEGQEGVVGEAAIGEVEAGQEQTASVEQVSLSEDTPESLYKRSDEALLRRQFGDAELGFKKFLTSYPDHNLAGSAQYWLGETYYAQGDYRTAAQNFLRGYQKYTKSRRAPDSLLKLGMALNKLGQKQQACVALGNVGAEYPKAVEAKKRAQTEFKRAGC